MPSDPRDFSGGVSEDASADIDFDAPRPFPILGDEDYPLKLAEANRDGHITEAELGELLDLHQSVSAARRTT